MNFFISDLHLYDEGILRVTQRPFASSKEMAMCIREKWNRKVSAKDTVYVLGDAGYVWLHKSPEQANGLARLMKSLNGKKVLVIGNHDRFNLEHRWFRDCFAECRTRLIIHDGPYRVFLDHYPVEDWDGMHTGTIHLHGHVHNNPVREIHGRFNVSVDVTGYAPASLEELCLKGISKMGKGEEKNG